MLKNYFITSLRNLRRNKVFSAINVLGLSIGISAALVIFLIVYYEFTFDRFEKDPDRIYRVVLHAKFGGTEGRTPAVPAPLSSAVQNEVTGIDLTVPVMQFQGDATAKVSVLIAFVIAAPIAWWSANKWLQDFAYRTTISWWVFVLSGLAIMVVALITLSIQTIKAAIANPVKSLRTE